MKELHDERLDIPVLCVCSVVCDVQMIEVIRKESMVTALDPMRLDFILTRNYMMNGLIFLYCVCVVWCVMYR
jgi:hypothetical protein